jgi:hypothetical protein
MSQNTSSHNKSTKLTNNVKVGKRTTHTDSGTSDIFHKYMSASFFSRKHLVTVGKLNDENGEAPVQYNTNVRFNSLTKGVKCQKRFRFFGHVVNNEQIFYDVPEFPSGF